MAAVKNQLTITKAKHSLVGKKYRLEKIQRTINFVNSRNNQGQ